MIDTAVRRLAAFSTARPWTVMGAWVLLMALCVGVIGVHGIAVDNRPEVFERRGTEAAAVLRELQDRFGRDDAFAVLVQGDVFSAAFLDQLAHLDEALSADPMPAGGAPATVVSLASATTLQVNAEGLAAEPLIDRARPLREIRTELLADDGVAGRLVSEDAAWAALWVRTLPMTDADSEASYHQIRTVVAAHDRPGFDTLVGGTPALSVRLNALTLIDMGRAFALAGLTMTAALVFLFRHPYGIVGPLLVVQGATIVVFAVMAGQGTSLNYLNSIVPTFLVAVGVGDGVHLQSLYRDLRADGVENGEAIRRAVEQTGRPVLYTSVTTMVGLLSFRLASIQPIIDLGTLAAIGVGVALALTLTALPAFLTLNTSSLLGAGRTAGRASLDRLIQGCSWLAREHTRPVLAVAALTAAFALALASQVQVAHDPLAWFPPELPTKQTQVALDRHFGGAAQLDLLVEGDLADPAVVAAIDALQTRIEAYRDPDGVALVGPALGPTTWLRRMPGATGVPDDPAILAAGLDAMAEHAPGLASRVMTPERDAAHLSFPLQWLPATRYGDLTRHVEAAIAELPPGVEARPTGLIYSLLSTMGVLVPDLARSFGMAFGVITLLMIGLLGDLRLGMLAMVPNLLPIVMTAGLMGAVGLPLDASTLLVFSVALGLCVDDTIHLLHHVQRGFERTGDVDLAIEASLSHAGRAIVATSLIIVAATLPTIASTLYSMVWFGLLIAFTIASALVADLVFTPALLRAVWAGGSGSAADRSR